MHVHDTDPSVAMPRGCVFSSFCIVFSSNFGAIGIDLATGGKLQPVESDSQNALRCWKR